MIANLVHTSLGYLGGAEALAVTTMESLADLGFDIELTVVEKPYVEKLRRTYGDTATSVLKNISIHCGHTTMRTLFVKFTSSGCCNC